MAPCILFIDDIDSILLETVTNCRQKTSSIVTQLSTCMDGKVNGFDRQVVLNTFFETADMIRLGLGQMKKKANVLVIAATKRLDILDKDLRLAGRFDSEIALEKQMSPCERKCSKLSAVIYGAISIWIGRFSLRKRPILMVLI